MRSILLLHRLQIQSVHRDRVNAKVMKEIGAQMNGKEPPEMPFNMKRMADGGFKTMVNKVGE